MKRFLFISFILISFVGCLSSPNFQTANPVEKGSSRLYTGITLQGLQFIESKKDDLDEKIIKENIEKKTLAGFVLGYRYGLGLNWDVGLELSLPGRLYFEGKYLIFSQNRHNLSVGTGLGGMIYPLKDEKHQLLSFFLPVYYSYNLNENMSMTTSIRYRRQEVVTTSDVDGRNYQLSHIWTASFGVQVKRFHIEASLSTVEKDLNIWTFGVGYDFF